MKRKRGIKWPDLELFLRRSLTAIGLKAAFARCAHTTKEDRNPAKSHDSLCERNILSRDLTLKCSIFQCILPHHVMYRGWSEIVWPAGIFSFYFIPWTFHPHPFVSVHFITLYSFRVAEETISDTNVPVTTNPFWNCALGKSLTGKLINRFDCDKLNSCLVKFQY